VSPVGFGDAFLEHFGWNQNICTHIRGYELLPREVKNSRKGVWIQIQNAFLFITIMNFQAFLPMNNATSDHAQCMYSAVGAILMLVCSKFSAPYCHIPEGRDLSTLSCENLRCEFVCNA
jgi:hypothetical protein